MDVLQEMCFSYDTWCSVVVYFNKYQNNSKYKKFTGIHSSEKVISYKQYSKLSA